MMKQKDELYIEKNKNMKVQASVKKRCKKCKIVKRRGRVHVVCDNKRHKQRQG